MGISLDLKDWRSVYGERFVAYWVQEAGLGWRNGELKFSGKI